MEKSSQKECVQTKNTVLQQQQQQQFPIDYASIRGKTILISPSSEQFELLKIRLQERIADNRGETIYEIGIGEGKTFI